MYLIGLNIINSDSETKVYLLIVFRNDICHKKMDVGAAGSVAHFFRYK
jgi:hypothetical protein